MNQPDLTIRKPTLLLDQARAIKNIEKMVSKARQSRVRLRPHFKTHQSAQIGQWFRQLGVEAITVSSVDMALYFAQHGWPDITIAFPVNILEIESINDLAGRVNLNLLVESEKSVRFLAENLTTGANIWLKVDVGYGRTGIAATDFETLGAVARQIETADRLLFRGLLTHSGHTYRARSKPEIEAIYEDTVAKMEQARQKLLAAGVGPMELSIGDTPSCSVVADLGRVDEIRPGNFVFYDLMQLHIGACGETDMAVAVACPVVAKHPERNELVIYGGAVHHSKEFLLTPDNTPIFGYVAPWQGNGWGPRFEQAYVSALSQEHGLIKADDDLINRLEVGDLVVVLPVHSCLTVNLMREYLTLAGEVIFCM